MVRRALIERRPWLLLSLLFGVTWWFIDGGAMPGLYQIAWKGAAVGCLAVYAFQRHLGRDGTLVAAVMALSCMADMLLELWYVAGGALFACAHLVAIWLYVQNRRDQLSLPQKLAAGVLFIGVPLDALLLAWGSESRWLIAAYALILGAMAAMAWISRFPRYRVGIGAILFVASDLLLIAIGGPLRDVQAAEWFVWPLYYLGQLMICTGIIGRLRGERA